MTAAAFRRVLVGWDGSADAAQALSIAVSVVGSDGGHVVALAVVPQAPHAEEDGGAEQAAVRRRVEDGFERARREACAVCDARVSLAVIENPQVGRAVCAYAEEHGFDLLVLGRHGDGAGLRPGLGRVAEAAVKETSIPVLLVSPE